MTVETYLGDQRTPRTDLVTWAENARAANQVAVSLTRTSFVPEAFRGRPEEATAAILSGAEVGLSPMAALRSFDIIQGTAAPRANTLRAVVQAAGHEVWVEESTDTRAVVCGRRHGSSQEQRSVWTIDRARKLGLTGKSNWQKQPQAMLVARATSEVCRLIASDAILGIPYAAEELGDDTDAADDTTPAPRPTRRTAQRRTPVHTDPPAPAPTDTHAAEPPPTPELPPLPGEHDDPAATPEPAPPSGDIPTSPDGGVTQAQLRKLHATLNDIGVTDRAERLAMVSDLTGRPLTSSNDLTRDEARHVLDILTGRLTSTDDDPPADLLTLEE